MDTLMNDNLKTLDLVREAGVGDRKSMEKLLEVTRPRLFSYLMRLTMDYHLAEDILQEVQTEILTSLWRLNNASHFWPWVYKNAWGKVRHHYRDTRKHKTIFVSDIEKDYFEKQCKTINVKIQSGRHEVDRDRLFETIYGAMKKLGLKQRHILSMRCFEDMSFYDIGEFLECSETSARVLFFRARNKIKNHLRRNGFKANKVFLPALGLFGAATAKTASASAPTAAVVSGSAVEVGFGASFIGFLTTKMGVLCSCLTSFFLAWFTLANLMVVGIITAALIPVIFVTIFYMALEE